MYYNYNFFNNLQKYRLNSKLTQSQLAKMVGVSKNTISSLERFECGCTAFTAFKLCKALNCKFEDLFYYFSFE